MNNKEKRKVALCLDNTDYEASLIVGKVYRVLPDPRAAEDDLLRIVDESGEDYLYHESLFEVIRLPKVAEEKLHAHGALV